MNLEKRIEYLEKVAKWSCSKIEEPDRMIIVPYPDGDLAERDRCLQEKLDALEQKYGTICQDDFIIVFIRKFSTDTPKKSD
ncbi:MAG TPA: hypothetical protein PLK94_12725 [Alphaproteobacteria bacterium]|mgnify:CR=1 FL=1|nr:hypothetical protein [Alphaproteobacteria bacterium]